MKVPLHLVNSRRAQVALWMQQHGHVSLQAVCLQFGVSEATARRDLAALAREKQIVRTYGGALAEYNHRFASFRERQERAAGAKRAIALDARARVRPGTTIFLDAGSTIYAVAEALQRDPAAPLEVVTNSLPVADLLASVPGVRLHLLGGELLPRQSALAGPATQNALKSYKIDTAFLGAEGMDARGLWNSQADVAAFQRQLIGRAKTAVFCLDATKLNQTAPVFLVGWERVAALLSDAPASALAAAGVVPRP